MRVAVVVQRYGTGVVGGAEHLARQYAEKMVKTLGWEVEVITTTAVDYQTWDNHDPAGTSQLNGVTIHRYPVVVRRLEFFQHFYGKFLFKLNRLNIRLNHRQKRRWSWLAPLVTFAALPWFFFQGPYCPDLVKKIKASRDDFSRFYFFTYLYYPTLWGLPRVKKKSVLISTAHDELPFYLPNIKRLLQQAGLIFVNLDAEGSLVRRVLPAAAHHKVHLVGTGYDKPLPTHVKPPILGPYLLYLGRISAGKGVDRLMQQFQQFQQSTQQNGAKATLVLAGFLDPHVTIPEDPSIQYLGFVDDAMKSSLLTHAAVLVNPSRHESLSLVALEAMAHGTPILVNLECEVLEYYCKNCPSAFGYHSSDDSFSRKLRELLDQDWKSEPALQEKLDQSRRWVEQNFSWDQVLKKIEQLDPTVSATVPANVASNPS